jgi:thiol-disulfide isomerase/thioredoxin
MSFFRKKPSCPQFNEDGTIDLDERCFDDFMAGNPKVVVMFHRTTCGHSVNMYPIFLDLCREMKEVKFCKVSTPTNMSLVHRYEVKGTPTFTIIINGKRVGSMTGETKKDLLKAEIERALSQ